MQSSNTELMKAITQLNALPKKDRKAIERQLSGLDKLAVKKAFKPKALFPSLDLIGKKNKAETTVALDDNATPNISVFSPWLHKKLSAILQLEDAGGLNSKGVTSAVADILPDCINRTNAVLEVVDEDNSKSGASMGFKAILAKLRSGEA